jgi:hypothetical protein
MVIYVFQFTNRGGNDVVRHIAAGTQVQFLENEWLLLCLPPVPYYCNLRQLEESVNRMKIQVAIHVAAPSCRPSCFATCLRLVSADKVLFRPPPQVCKLATPF